MTVPTREIIILARQSSIINYALRADVPVGQENAYKNPLAESPVGSTGDPDVPFMVTGQIAQTIQSIDLPQGSTESGAQYRARAQTVLENQWSAYQTRISNSQPQAFFGAFWNGTSWANSGA